MSPTRSSRISPLVSVAAAIVIVTLSLLPFLTPQWVAFEQDRAAAASRTGFSEAQLREVTDSILADLVVGPPAFDVAIGGEAVLNDREREHMRDVRTVFLGSWVLGAVALVLVVVGAILMPRSTTARAIARGARVLAVAVVAVGIVAAVAFETLFEVFHRLLFAGGTYTFDPATERLVQLFPFTFWQETAIVVGAVIVLVSLIVAAVGGRAAGRDSMRIEGAAGGRVAESTR